MHTKWKLNGTGTKKRGECLTRTFSMLIKSLEFLLSCTTVMIFSKPIRFSAFAFIRWKWRRRLCSHYYTCCMLTKIWSHNTREIVVVVISKWKKLFFSLRSICSKEIVMEHRVSRASFHHFFLAPKSHGNEEKEWLTVRGSRSLSN